MDLKFHKGGDTSGHRFLFSGIYEQHRHSAFLHSINRFLQHQPHVRLHLDTSPENLLWLEMVSVHFSPPPLEKELETKTGLCFKELLTWWEEDGES